MTDESIKHSFDALDRVYGVTRAAMLRDLNICVIGIGGVGSWAAEALARTAVGRITLIDADDVTAGNINRQILATASTLARPKVTVMQERIGDINPACQCTAVDDMLVDKNMPQYITTEFDYVIDAIDSIRFKSALINHCRRAKIKIISTGGAGGRVDPSQVSIGDLSLTWNDALAAKVRRRLRSQYGFSRNPQSRFGVECVFSSEQPVFPSKEGDITHEKPGVPGATLDCDAGYGSTASVTGTFGLMAAARAINKSLARKLRETQS